MEDKLLLKRPDAVSLGQKLIDSGFIRHVCDSRDFFDSEFFYTNRKAELSTQGLPLSLPFGMDKDRQPVLLHHCIQQLEKDGNYKTQGIFRLSVQTALLERLILLIGCCNDGGLFVLNCIKGTSLPLLYAQLIKVFFCRMTNDPLSLSMLEDCALLDKNSKIDDDNVFKQIKEEILKYFKSSVAFKKTILLIQKVAHSPETSLNANDLAKLFVPVFFRIDTDNVQNYIALSEKATQFLTVLIYRAHEIFAVYN